MMNYKQLTNILNTYSAVMFIKHPAAGLMILITTLWHPNIGLSGLLSTLTGLATLRLFQLPKNENSIYTLNSLLVGLSLGAFFELNTYLVLLIILSAIMVIFLSVTLADGLWRMDRIPLLSLPFVIVAILASLIAHNTGKLNNYLSISSNPEPWLGTWADTFFNSLGATFFTPHPLVGGIIFLCMLVYSRYLAFLACCGYIVGLCVFIVLVDNPQPHMIAWSGFNFVLTAIALGGIYTVPGVASFFFAMLGAGLAALLSASIQNILLVYGLPVMALPFVLVTLTLLIAMKKRTKWSSLILASEPGPPELNYERSRLAHFRQGGFGSIPLLAPFYGKWNIYQGFNGHHTHQPPWQHALDFFIQEDEKSFTLDGNKLEDYFCYGVPVQSPVYGLVVRTVDNIADNPPGEINTKNNWGNFILIRLDTGLHVLLAHLSQKSIKVKEGDWIKPGTIIANCGSSGRSPQPHLHLQVQQDATLGSPTVAFHLCSVITSKSSRDAEYKVVSRPEEHDTVEPAEINERMSARLHFPVGRTLHYAIEGTDISDETRCKLRVEVTLAGQFRIVSDSGASVALTEANGVLAFYDRTGPADILMDMWTLGLGLTPLTERAIHWNDSPPATLLPLTYIQRFYLSLLHPLGSGLNSRYQRQWDKESKTWIQHGKHELKVATTRLSASTTAILDPEAGCTQLTLTSADKKWRAHLIETGLAEDEGIPGWRSLSSGNRPSELQNDEMLRQQETS